MTVCPGRRDIENEFCRFSFLGYLKRNDFVPIHNQKKQPETMSYGKVARAAGKDSILCNMEAAHRGPP